MKRQQIFPVSIEQNGRTYTATRIVEGTRVLSQHLVVNGQKESDSATYKPGQEVCMELMAKLILGQLATSGSLGQLPLEPDK